MGARRLASAESIRNPSGTRNSLPAATVLALAGVVPGGGVALVLIPLVVGLLSAFVAYGRWRLALTGEANHAGTTRLADRHDPMFGLAAAVPATS